MRIHEERSLTDEERQVVADNLPLIGLARPGRRIPAGDRMGEGRSNKGDGMKFLYGEFWWAVHNLIAHPVMQILRFASLFGLIRPVDKFGEWLHDWTTPKETA